MTYHPNSLYEGALRDFIKDLIDVHIDTCDNSDGLPHIITYTPEASANISKIEKQDNNKITLSIEGGKTFTLYVVQQN